LTKVWPPKVTEEGPAFVAMFGRVKTSGAATVPVPANRLSVTPQTNMDFRRKMERDIQYPPKKPCRWRPANGFAYRAAVTLM
jgi:hypothetical protein